MILDIFGYRRISVRFVLRSDKTRWSLKNRIFWYVCTVKNVFFFILKILWQNFLKKCRPFSYLLVSPFYVFFRVSFFRLLVSRFNPDHDIFSALCASFLTRNWNRILGTHTRKFTKTTRISNLNKSNKKSLTIIMLFQCFNNSITLYNTLNNTNKRWPFRIQAVDNNTSSIATADTPVSRFFDHLLKKHEENIVQENNNSGLLESQKRTQSCEVGSQVDLCETSTTIRVFE